VEVSRPSEFITLKQALLGSSIVEEQLALATASAVLVHTDVVLAIVLECTPVAIKAAVFELPLGDEIPSHQTTNSVELVTLAELAKRDPVGASESLNRILEDDSCGRLALDFLQSHWSVLPPGLKRFEANIAELVLLGVLLQNSLKLFERGRAKQSTKQSRVLLRSNIRGMAISNFRLSFGLFSFLDDLVLQPLDLCVR